MKLLLRIFLAAAFINSAVGVIFANQPKNGTVVTERLVSTVLRDNLVNLSPDRLINVYLPPGYAESTHSYPVVYYCHNIGWSAAQMFQDGKLAALLERGFAQGIAREFILVAADYSTVQLGSLYENSPVSGRWLDFTVQELVPFIDHKFRTLPRAEGRALSGDFMGGRGALILAILHPEIFSVVYALHPVATGIGYLPWSEFPVDWKNIREAKSFNELKTDGRERIFVAIHQAFLPNPNRPPFYCDFSKELEDGELKFNVEHTQRMADGFLLDHYLRDNLANLRKLRALAFDWARYDQNQEHVFANQAFTKKLEDLGIEHEAEEYRGDPWHNFTENGRFYARVLPFMNRHLAFEEK